MSRTSVVPDTLSRGAVVVLVLLAASGCASYAGGSFKYAANPDLQTVMLFSGTPNPVGVWVAEVETKKRGGRGCTELGNEALRELLAQAKGKGAVGVKNVAFRGRSGWIGQIVCKDSMFGRGVQARGVAYSLGEMVSIPRPVSIRLLKGMRPQFTEVAILSVVSQQSMPAWVTTYVQPASYPLEALKLQWMDRNRGTGWRPESRKLGLVVAGYQREQFAMRVAVEYTKETVIARILDSKNLGQTRTHISGEAANGFRDFVGKIQVALTDLAARR